MARNRGQVKGCLQKLKSGSWFGQWYEYHLDADGNEKPMRRGKVIARWKGPEAVGKKEAFRVFKSEVLDKLNEINRRPKSLITVREFIARHFRKVVAKQGSRHLSDMVRWIEADLGDVMLQAISPRRAQEYLDAKSAEGKAPGTVAHYRNALTRIFGYAKLHDLYHGDIPTAFVELPKLERKQRGSLSPEAVIAIADYLEMPYRQFWLVLALLGLRAGEALGLRWGRINLTDAPVWSWDGEQLPPHTLAIRETYTKNAWKSTAKTPGSQQILPMPQRLVAELAMLKPALASPFDAVFAVNGNPKPFEPANASRKKLKPALRALGLNPDISWHWARHTLSTLADEAGMTGAQRQRLMRHSSQAMTDHYTHADLLKAREGLDAVAERIYAARKSPEVVN